MRVIARAPLRDFWTSHADAEDPLKAWLADAEKAQWQSPNDITANYASASILGDSRVCFNIKGNRYRLIVKVIYKAHVVYVKFIGTHADYDKINAEEVSLY